MWELKPSKWRVGTQMPSEFDVRIFFNQNWKNKNVKWFQRSCTTFWLYFDLNLVIKMKKLFLKEKFDFSTNKTWFMTSLHLSIARKVDALTFGREKRVIIESGEWLVTVLPFPAEHGVRCRIREPTNTAFEITLILIIGTWSAKKGQKKAKKNELKKFSFNFLEEQKHDSFNSVCVLQTQKT